jgi:hypothetical protein
MKISSAPIQLTPRKKPYPKSQTKTTQLAHYKNLINPQRLKNSRL